ncbi:Hypothetical predicted protein [Octopus vulgaris]|uniref:Uncharacterized protein n=1 Tax=Octopus vulgaris TaxID=6645 RepID=A0AA36FBV0_OCTVU|nr:Hypothetical predicted protein [Octopus vulgaris]
MQALSKHSLEHRCLTRGIVGIVSEFRFKVNKQFIVINVATPAAFVVSANHNSFLNIDFLTKHNSTSEL